MSLDPGQAEAGRSLGLNYFDTMRFIVVPQAFKAILPSLGNEFIILLKDTSLSPSSAARSWCTLLRPSTAEPTSRCSL